MGWLSGRSTRSAGGLTSRLSDHHHEIEGGKMKKGKEEKMSEEMKKDEGGSWLVGRIIKNDKE